MQEPMTSLHPFPDRREPPGPGRLGREMAPPPAARRPAARVASRGPWRALLLFCCGAFLPLLLESWSPRGDAPLSLEQARITRAGSSEQLAALAEALRTLLARSP